MTPLRSAEESTMKAILAALLATATLASTPLGAADLPEVEVYKSPYRRSPD